MRLFTCVACFIVAFATVPVSFSYADDGQNDKKDKAITLEEASELIDSLPTASDAVTGTVSTDGSKYYDIYGRQVAFRESAKDLRESLDQRRENFENPRVEALELYRGTVGKVYASETEAYQNSLEKKSDDKMEMDSDEEENVEVSAVSSDNKKDTAPEVEVTNDTQEDAGPDLVEKPIPSDDTSEGAPKKKVVMPEDAPDFDPADL